MSRNPDKITTSTPSAESDGALFPVRAVHLDLKGAPPTFPRLLRLLDIVHAAGYNAVLVEWEDMFPWSVDVRFRCETAYSLDEVRTFAEHARELDVEIIPLVQCLGHMETPLSVPGYESLREVADQPDVLNPLAPGATGLVKGMIDDVLDALPGVRRFHLGGDEAWTFGTHPDTRRYVEEHGPAALYMRHVAPLLDRLEERGVRAMLWHDMMREWPVPALQDLARRADLVVWGYHGHPDTTTSHYRREVIEHFHRAGVPMWCATAYKGADGPDSDLPDPDTRLPNARAWAEIAPRYGFRGCIATAWSRYSTHATQCEPIDGALDLLAAVGIILRNGPDAEHVLDEARALLDRIGEGERFRACHGALKELRDLRAAGWNAVKNAAQLAAMTAGDGRRRQSLPYRRATARAADIVERLDGVARAFRTAFHELMPDLWIARYLAERIEPIREFSRLIEARNRQTTPEFSPE